MVSTQTFIIVTIVFLASHYIFDRKAKQLFENRKGWHFILFAIIVESLLIILSIQISICFYLLLYGTVIIASLIESFYRYKYAIILDN